MSKLRLTVEEAAREASVSRSQMYELIRRGAIPSSKIGRSRGVLLADLQEYLESTRIVVEQQEVPGWPGQQRGAPITMARSTRGRTANGSRR